jgi:O-antigen/teichoic acid export membrane protein
LFAGNVISSVFALIIYSLSVKALGAELFGILVIIQTYVLIVDTIVKFNSWQALIKFGAEAFENKQVDEFKGFVKQASLLDVGSSVLGTIIAVSFAYIIGKWLHWDIKIVPMAMLYSIVILFNLSGAPTGILRLYNRFKLLAIQKTVSSGVKLVATLIAFLLTKNLWVYIIIWVLTDIIGNIFLLILGYYVLHKNGIRAWWKCPVSNFKRFFTFTFWTNITSTLDIPVKQLDVFVVSAVIGFEGVAIYKILKEIAKVIGQVGDPIYQAAYPEFASMIAKKENIGAVKFAAKLGIIIFSICIPIALVVSFLSPWWLNALFGKVFAAAWVSLSVYLLLQVISTSFITIHPLFVAMGYVQKNFIILAIANATYFALAWILGMKIGLMGVVLAYGVQFCIVILLKIFYISKGIKKERLTET